MNVGDLSRPVHVYDIKELDGNDARVAGVSVNRNGLVAIVNEKHKKVHLFDSNRRHMHEFSIEQEGKNNDLYVSQVLIDHKGNLAYVTFDSKEIFRYNLNGKRVPAFAQMKDDQQLPIANNPAGFAATASGMVAISSTFPSKILIAHLNDSPESLQDIYSEENTLVSPGPLCFGPDGYLYVACDPNVYLLDKNGGICREISTSGKLNRPEGVYVSGKGCIFCTDYDNHKVCVISPEGELLHTFGSHGKEEGCFDQPVGISMDFEGYLYVADSANGRVQVF